MQVTVRSALAMRTARSTRWRICARHRRHVDIVARHILEERYEIDLLLEIAAHRHPRLLPDDGHHALVVHLRIVKAIEQMDGPRPAGGKANADFAGEFGMRAGHERRHFLMPHLHIIDLVARPPNRADDPVDAIARESIDAPDAPFVQTLESRNR